MQAQQTAAPLIPSRAPELGAAFVRGLRPLRRRDVAQWAEEERQVSRESGSPNPGKWSNDYVPEMVEVMQCLSPLHPARAVVVKKCNQIAGSEAGLNMLGHCIQDDPAPTLVVLPTTEEVRKYVRIKLQPMIEATPGVKAKVRDQKSRDEESSTTTFKKFEGGYLQVAGANSSAGLQMISVKKVILEEVSEYPFDVDNRGDPVDLAIKRTVAYDGFEKVAFISTPALKGTCRVTKRYELSDQRVRYVPCPHCGVFQPLLWDRLERETVAPLYKCMAHGCVIEESSKSAMRRAGVWIKTFTKDEAPFPKTFTPEQIAELGNRIKPDVLMDGRQPGFFINALYSPTKSWTTIVTEWREAQNDDSKMKVFTQQVLGEPWEVRGEAPDHERLFEKRVEFEWRKLPLKALFMTGACDVQGDRLEWAVYAWGYGFTSWLIDKGVIEGDPNGTEAWEKLAETVNRTWPDSSGRRWKVDAFGVDCGYQSQACYRFVRSQAATGRCFALKGMPGWRRPALGTPSAIDIDYEGKKIGAVMLWPVGTWGLKSELYSGIGKLLKGPRKDTGEFPTGTAFYSDACDSFYLQQLTAEAVVLRKAKSGASEQVWEKVAGRRNEAHDLAVYCRALAHHLADPLDMPAWENLAAARGTTLELSSDSGSVQPRPVKAPPVAAPAPETPRQQQPAEDWLGDRARNFWN